jgi:hypothetical protein
VRGLIIKRTTPYFTEITPLPGSTTTRLMSGLTGWYEYRVIPDLYEAFYDVY